MTPRGRGRWRVDVEALLRVGGSKAEESSQLNIWTHESIAINYLTTRRLFICQKVRQLGGASTCQN